MPWICCRSYLPKEGGSNPTLTLEKSLTMRVVDHARPAAQLDGWCIPTHLSSDDLRNFHRPRLVGDAKVRP